MTKHRERVVIRNTLKHGAAGINAFAFQHYSINKTTQQHRLVCTSANTAQNLPKDSKGLRTFAWKELQEMPTPALHTMLCSSQCEEPDFAHTRNSPCRRFAVL